MRSRLLRFLVLGFTCLWFGVLVPIHQRGQIQLPGSSSNSHCDSSKAVPSCCSTKPGKSADGKHSPTQSQRENCAVCHFIAGLDVPPPVTMYVERLGFLERLPAEVAQIAPLRHAALPFHGLDPPSA